MSDSNADDVRRLIEAAMPELELIESDDLRQKVVDVWALALDESSFSDINEIPGEPEIAPGINQVAHQRGVARIALRMGEEIAAVVPGFSFSSDVVVAGALVHDVGKAYEYDSERATKWRARPQDAGYPPIRHPAYGVHLALTVGLPEAVAHICAAHASEGDYVQRSLEASLVHYADYAFWEAVAKAETGLSHQALELRGVLPDGLRAVPAKFTAP